MTASMPSFRSPAVCAALVVVISLAIGLAFAFKVSRKMPDFEVYWRAGQRAAAGEALYRAGDGHYQFKYLPVFALVVSPLTRLDQQSARALWFVLSVVSLAMLVLLSVRLWRPPGLLPPSLKLRRTSREARPTSDPPPDEARPANDPPVRPWLVVILTLLVLGKFFSRELVLGQANAMFGVITAGAILALSQRRERLAGALVALGVVFKPYGLILLPWLIARRRSSSIATFAAGLLIAVALPLLRYDPGTVLNLHRQWWATVRDSTAPNLLNPDNVSWLAMYARWLGEGALARSVWLLTLAAVAGAVVWMWVRRRAVESPERLEGALLLMLVPLVSPQGWDYVLLLAAPAVVGLITHLRDQPRWLTGASSLAMGAIGLTIYDVMGRTAYHAFMMASGITLCTFVLIAGLVGLRARHIA
jgi:hypothetical protein